MKNKLIQLKEGDTGTIKVLIATSEKRKNDKGSSYLSLNVQDDTMTMDAKYWNLTDEQIAMFPAGTFADAKYQILVHKAHLQMRIHDMKPITEGIDVTKFVRSAPIQKDELMETIFGCVTQMQDKDLQLMTQTFLNDYEEQYFTYPAAVKNHHNVARGLAYHCYGMLKMAQVICELHDYLNKDLLFAGIILHDLGKIDELSGVIAPQYTKEGKLIGHISIMHGKMMQIQEKYQLNSESILLLRHMILSHHGQFEFGSPVLPAIAEAEILHYLDNLDARINAIENALEGVEEGEFSPRIFALENRSIYKQKKS